MTGHIYLDQSPVRPRREPVQICVACAEGDHEQVLRRECCACPCHGTYGLTTDAGLAA